MQAIILAVVSALAGAVAGVVPALLVSGRRRRAAAVTEAADLLQKVKGTPAEESVRAALKVNAADYLAYVAEGAKQRMRRQRRAASVLLCAAIFGVAVTAFVAWVLPVELTPRVRLVFPIFIMCALIPMSYLVIKSLILTITEGPEPPTLLEVRRVLRRRRGQDS